MWVAFEMLYRIEWAWNISRDYLRKKTLTYKSAEDCAKSALRLGFHSLRGEIKNLQPKQKRKKSTFFCRRNFLEKNLNKVLQRVYESEECVLSQISEKSIPHAIELLLEDDIQLRLSVEWIPGVIEVCHVHSFQDDHTECAKNSRRNFVCDLLDKPGKRVQIRVSGENAKEYLRRVGIKGVVAKLFIKEAKADTAILRSKPVALEGMSEATLKKVCSAIQKLKAVRWD